MGSSLVLPEQNARLKKVMKTFNLNRGDMGRLWSYFQRLDRQKVGKIRSFSIFDGPEIQKSVLCESLFSLLDIELDQDQETLIGFPEFVHCVVALCCFEPNEMLRFCHYCYDPERNGHISIEDYKALMNSLHGIIPPEKADGNVRESWMHLKFPANEKIEIDDVLGFHKQAPLILQPAFRFQQLMAVKYGGVAYWTRKKRRLMEDRARADRLLEKKRAKKEKKLYAKRDAKVKKSMGILRYYLCPCIRFMYDPDDERGMTEAQKAAIALQKRTDELALKNPQTAAWRTLEKKIDPTKGGSERYVAEKLAKTERPREERAQSRAERRAERKQDDTLAHKFRTLGDDVELLQ